jgi:hypothetical protein
VSRFIRIIKPFGNRWLTAPLYLELNRNEQILLMMGPKHLQERRKASREQTQFRAWVETAQKKLSPCTVLNETLKGARVRATDLALPAEFTLVLDDKSLLKRRCKVVWRRGYVVGLEFV